MRSGFGITLQTTGTIEVPGDSAPSSNPGEGMRTNDKTYEKET